MHDLVIRNATVIDGLGNPGREGESLAVREGRIAAIGAEVGRGAEEIDAEGRVLCPGIVDLHTHFDAQLTWDSYATPSVGLGVTTVVAGNCGFTIAPCREADRDRTLRNLTHVEGMSIDALREGVDWDFETYPEYLAMLERKGTVPNVACFVGHSSVRTYVLGEEASSRAASASEVAQMKRIVKDAMEAGGDRLLDHHPRAAQRRERDPHALAPRRRARDVRAHRGPRGGRQGGLHADEGHDEHHSLARGDRRPQRPPGDGRRDAGGSQRPRARVPRARRDLGGEGPRPGALGPGRLLPPRDGVLPRSSLSPRGVPRVASRHRGLESRGRSGGCWPIPRSGKRSSRRR